MPTWQPCEASQPCGPPTEARRLQGMVTQPGAIPFCLSLGGQCTPGRAGKRPGTEPRRSRKPAEPGGQGFCPQQGQLSAPSEVWVLWDPPPACHGPCGRRGRRHHGRTSPLTAASCFTCEDAGRHRMAWGGLRCGEVRAGCCCPSGGDWGQDSALHSHIIADQVSLGVCSGQRGAREAQGLGDLGPAAGTGCHQAAPVGVWRPARILACRC